MLSKCYLTMSNAAEEGHHARVRQPRLTQVHGIVSLDNLQDCNPNILILSFGEP